MSDADSRTANARDERISVVVLTHNRADQAAQTVQRLLELPEQPRIVVVDNASVDGTADVLRARFPSVTVLHLDENLGAAGRNVGVRACDTPYVALCDDDTWWEAGCLRRAADIFDGHPQFAVLSARVLVGDEDRLDPTCAQMAKSPLELPGGLPGSALMGFLAGASAVRRAAFMQAGGFEPRLFLGAEEELLALDLVSAGWAMAYVSELVVHHHPSVLRDGIGRRHLLARNSIWIAWMRRPIGRALLRTLALAARAFVNPTARRALADALRGMPWALRRRRVVPAAVERQLRILERHQYAA